MAGYPGTTDDACALTYGDAKRYGAHALFVVVSTFLCWMVSTVANRIYGGIMNALLALAASYFVYTLLVHLEGEVMVYLNEKFFQDTLARVWDSFRGAWRLKTDL